MRGSSFESSYITYVALDSGLIDILHDITHIIIMSGKHHIQKLLIDKEIRKQILTVETLGIHDNFSQAIAIFFPPTIENRNISSNTEVLDSHVKITLGLFHTANFSSG